MANKKMKLVTTSEELGLSIKKTTTPLDEIIGKVKNDWKDRSKYLSNKYKSNEFVQPLVRDDVYISKEFCLLDDKVSNKYWPHPKYRAGLQWVFGSVGYSYGKNLLFELESISRNTARAKITDADNGELLSDKEFSIGEKESFDEKFIIGRFYFLIDRDNQEKLCIVFTNYKKRKSKWIWEYLNEERQK